MITGLIIFLIILGIAWQFAKKDKDSLKSLAFHKNEIPKKIKTVISAELNPSHYDNYYEDSLDDSSYEKYPIKKIFVAETFLDTPLKFLAQHGNMIEIFTKQQDEETSGFTRYGHWFYVDKYNKDFVEENVLSNSLSVKILSEIREIYEKIGDYELGYEKIKFICDKYSNSQFVIFNSVNQEIASYYYPSVLSFALGIKRNQVEALQQFDIHTIDDLENKTDTDLLNIPNIGKKTLTALRTLQSMKGIPKNIQRMPRDKELWKLISQV